MPRAERSNSLTPSVRSTVATCCEIPDCVAFSRSPARVNEPSSQTAMTARTCRRAMLGMGVPLEKLMLQPRIYYFGQGNHGARIRLEDDGAAAAAQAGRDRWARQISASPDWTGSSASTGTG